VKAGTKVSVSGWIVLVASMLVTALLYYADIRNAPVLAPWLDLLADRIYRWLPILARLAPNAAMFLSSAVVGLVFFLIGTVIAACFTAPSSKNDRIESQLKKHAAQRSKRRLDDDDFLVD